MGSIDLKDAYYSIPVAPPDRKFLRFHWQGKLYQFTALPMGLSESPRKFTKIMKVPFAFLRAQGFENSTYLDDSFLVGQTSDECEQNIHCTAELLDNSGFTIHVTKSVLVPTQRMIYLGFILDSICMTVRPMETKVAKIQSLCEQILKKSSLSIRQFAEVIGNLVALEPGADMAPIYFRRLEIYKTQQLK